MTGLRAPAQLQELGVPPSTCPVSIVLRRGFFVKAMKTLTAIYGSGIYIVKNNHLGAPYMKTFGAQIGFGLQ